MSAVVQLRALLVRALGALALVGAGACTEATSTSIVVAVDADEHVLARAREIEVATYDGETLVDRTALVPTGPKPYCLPFSIGVAPKPGHETAEVGVVISASLKTGSVVKKRFDVRFAPGVHLLEVTLGRECAMGCDTRETIAELPIADPSALARRAEQTDCRELIPARECINRGGCFEELELDAPVCKLPCDSPTPPMAPAEPHPPAEAATASLLPCPVGWSEVPPSTPGDVTTCEPHASDAPECPEGSWRPPGRSTCEVLGGACADVEWPMGLPAGRAVVYVRPDAAPGGDGSLGAPLANVRDAIARAPAGGIVALGAGRHLLTSGIVVDKPLLVVGTCPEETVIDGGSMGADTVATATTARVELRAITVRGGRAGIVARGGALGVESVRVTGTSSTGLALSRGARAEARDLLIDRTGGPGITAQTGTVFTATAAAVRRAVGSGVFADGAGTTVDLTDVDVEDVAPGPDRFGPALRAYRGASVHVRRGAFAHGTGYGLHADGAGTRLVLEDVVVRDMGRTGTERLGDGVRLEGSATATLARVVVERARHVGIYANDGATLTVTDVLVRDVLSEASTGAWGMGVICSSRCALSGARLTIDRAKRRALELDPDTTTMLEDVIIRGTRPSEDDGRYGHGIEVGEGTQATIRRARVLDCRDTGVALWNGAHLVLEDAIIEDTGVDGRGGGGKGLDASAPVNLQLTRARIARSQGTGLRADTDESAVTRLVLTDVDVLDTQPTDGDDDGMGIVVGTSGNEAAHAPADLQLSRVRALRNATAGISIGRVEAQAEDLIVTDTVVGRKLGVFGVGLQSAVPGVFRGTRVLFARNVDAGILSAAKGSEIYLEDAAIIETSCAVDKPDCGVYRGAGVAIAFEGYVSLERFVLDRNTLNGLQLNFVGGADLVDGEVAHHPTGTYVRAGDFDVPRIAVRVRYHDNGENVAVADE